MNKDNELKLKQGSYGVVLNLIDGRTIFVPVVKSLANARAVEVNDDGSLFVHWDSNYNLNGDFRTELMLFNNNLQLNELDKEVRNDVRKANGLVPLN